MSKQRNPSLSASPARRARGGRGFRRRPVGLGAITATLLLGSALALAVPATQATAQSEARQKIWLWADNEPGTGDLPGLNEDAFDLSQGYSPHEGRGYATFYVRTDQAHWACADITVEESGSSNKAAASDFTTMDLEDQLVGGSSYSSTRFEVPVADDTSREGPERFVAKLDSVSRAYKIRPGDGQADYPACVQPSTDRCNIPTVQRPCWDYYTTAIPEKSVPWRPTPNPDPPVPDPLPIDLPLNEGASSVDVWIADNDGAHFTMSGPTSITEGESATFRVTVSNKKSGTDMEVQWRLVETGRSNSAHVFQSASTTDDFTGATGGILADFMYNNQTREFTVTTDDDGDDEHNEDIYVRLIGFSDEGPIPIYGGDRMPPVSATRTLTRCASSTTTTRSCEYRPCMAPAPSAKPPRTRTRRSASRWRGIRIVR